jgi:hypothetical protein
MRPYKCEGVCVGTGNGVYVVYDYVSHESLKTKVIGLLHENMLIPLPDPQGFLEVLNNLIKKEKK